MKIAFIVEYYYPIRHDATGKICKEICDFLSNNDEITAVSMSDYKTRPYKDGNVNIICFQNLSNIFMPQFLFLEKNTYGLAKIQFFVRFLFSKIINCAMTFVFGSKSKTMGFSKFVRRTIIENKFDAVVFCCGNYGLLQAINSKINKIYKNELFLYSLDPFDEEKLKLGNTDLKKITKDFCFLFLPPAFVFNHPEFGSLNNVIPVDFPIIFNSGKENEKKHEKPLLSYFGAFYNVRDNDKVCSVLNNLHQYVDVIFYTDTIPLLKKRYPNILFKDFIFGEALQKAEEEADFFINIDNNVKFKDYVPSKTFEYLGWGKPIITFFTNPGSYTLKELSKYDLSLNVSLNEKNETNDIKILRFIGENMAKYSHLDLPLIYEKNQLHNICFLFDNVFKKQNKDSK